MVGSKRAGYVDFAACDPLLLKIGFSISPAKRIEHMKSRNRWVGMTLHPNARVESMHGVGYIKCNEDKEAIIHKQFAEYRLSGEWFRATEECSSAIHGLPGFLPAGRTVFYGDTLSASELLLLEEFMKNGACNKEIGRIMDLAEQTVKNHMHSVMRKLKVKSRVELLLAVERGVIGVVQP